MEADEMINQDDSFRIGNITNVRESEAFPLKTNHNISNHCKVEEFNDDSEFMTRRKLDCVVFVSIRQVSNAFTTTICMTSLVFR